MEMHHELAILVQVTDIEFLGIVRDEPVDQPQTNGARTGQNRKHGLESPRLIVEILEPANNEVLFALDAILECLAGGVHSLMLDRRLGLDGHRDSAVLVEGR